MSIKIKVKKIHEDAIIPKYAYPTDSGFDLYTYKNTYIKPNEKTIIKTGLAFGLPKEWGVQIKNKSGITVKGVPTINGERADITVYEGTIDSNYIGEIGIMVKNETDKEIIIPKHTKVAQGVLRKVHNSIFELVDELEETDRGTGGYGSTGTTVN